MRHLLIISLFLISIIVQAQVKNEPGKSLIIKKATHKIHIDGVLDEADWKAADVATDFFLNYPVDTARAPFQSEARLTFDDHHLYVSFVCQDDASKDIIQSLRRDFDFEGNDHIGVYLGTLNDRINGFYFQITPHGVQAEGIISGGGAGDDSYNDTWDNKWYSKVVKEGDRWTAELMIPFKSIRYKNEVSEWNITFLRNDVKRNHISSWIATPIQFIPASFAYSGQLKWRDPLPPGRGNISLIPYLAGGISQDREQNPTERASDLQVGFDAKVAVTPSLNLDLTVNPDFSQVEVDRQVINLTRFEFQFPERRQFFLENSDLFDNAGFPDARPFFSRRIGLARDTTENESIVQVPIAYGARLSGSLNEKWRVGLLHMQTREKESIGLPQQNYTVAAIQRNFWKQSNMSFIYVDKQSHKLGDISELRYPNASVLKYRKQGSDSIPFYTAYNRVVGVDVDLLSQDNKWYTSAYYTASFDDGFDRSSNQSAGFFGRFNTRNIGFFGGSSIIQKNYQAATGFVPSRGVYPGQINFFGGANYTWFPTDSKIARSGPGIEANYTNLPDGTHTDASVAFNYSIDFLNTSGLNFGWSYTYQRLTNSFNPIDDEVFTSFLEGEEYHWNNYSVVYSSDQRKAFNYFVATEFGSFYNGKSWNVLSGLNYRIQPYGSLAIQAEYNDLRLATGYGEEKFWLISPRLDVTFTDKLFLTTFIQYNELSDNVNLNARFQWRYQPASDFFVVYTENYLPEQFKSKNRSIVFKFTYWLNL
jgi:hypothetical protein